MSKLVTIALWLVCAAYLAIAVYMIVGFLQENPIDVSMFVEPTHVKPTHVEPEPYQCQVKRISDKWLSVTCGTKEQIAGLKTLM